ncbi:MAG: serine/threonine protein kinase [Bryobacterales bacterium]|nr:serine/threonine protein kinase [Bryobacterales bacterium]
MERLVPRLAVCQPGASTAGTLPPEVMRGAVKRLEWVAGIFATIFVIMFLAFRPAAAGLPGAAEDFAFFRALTLSAVTVGGGMAAIARWSRLSPALLLDLGLVFEVVAAFLVSMSDSHAPMRADGIVQGQPTVAAWVAMFALAVPASLGKAAVAAFASAATGPLAMLANAAFNGIPMPKPSQILALYLLPFLMAAASVALSRYVYDLGRSLSAEREMGAYRLLERLGQGGMGEVWRAQHRSLVRDAAVKLIRPEALGSTPDTAAAANLERRFALEARATAALQSPHTVSVYDYGRAADGSFYYVMELLDGFDLEDFVKRFGPMPASRAVYVLRQVCESLAEAHHAGLIHRDIKPRNIFLSRLGLACDFAKVLDFGLVKTKSATGAGETQNLTGVGMAAGTPAYMAPELALGQSTDARTDLYAVGCVAYWLLTGRLVFDGGSPLAMAMNHVNTALVRPSERTEMEISAEFDELILDCLAKDPRHRPQSARDLGRRLAALPLPAWTAERAEDWWRIHMPGRPRPLVHAPPELA